MIPESIKQVLPENGQKYFLKMYSKALSDMTNEAAVQYAWEACKLKMNKNGVLVANSEAFEEQELFTFNFSESDITVVMNAESDELIMEAELANTDPNTEGKYFTEQELSELSEQINASGSSLPDFEHEELKQAVKMFGPDPVKIREHFKTKKGVFKTITSIIRQGKLWIRATLDKRYKNHVDTIKRKASIEAIATREAGSGRLTKPQYLGFTLTGTPKITSVSSIRLG